MKPGQWQASQLTGKSIELFKEASLFVIATHKDFSNYHLSESNQQGVAILICNTSNYVITKYNGIHSVKEPLNNEKND